MIPYITEAYYYRMGDTDAENTEAPLLVNCSGVTYMKNSFAGGYPKGRNDFYMIYMLGGRMNGVFDGIRISLSKGDVICISPGKSCVYRSAPALREPVCYLWAHFTGSEAMEAIVASGISPDTVYHVALSDEIFRHFDRLNAEMRRPSRSPHFDYVTGLELRYVLRLLATGAEEVRKRAKLDFSVRYIHDHITEKLSVEELAAMEYLSASRYREVFRELMGISPSEYITRLRVERAKDILSIGGLSISEVAETVGYKDRLYFQRVFKKCTGKTPGEYLKM